MKPKIDKRPKTTDLQKPEFFIFGLTNFCTLIFDFIVSTGKRGERNMKYRNLIAVLLLVTVFVIGALLATVRVWAENGTGNEEIVQKLDEAIEAQSKILQQLEVLEEKISQQLDNIRKELHVIKIRASQARKTALPPANSCPVRRQERSRNRTKATSPGRKPTAWYLTKSTAPTPSAPAAAMPRAERRDAATQASAITRAAKFSATGMRAYIASQNEVAPSRAP